MLIDAHYFIGKINIPNNNGQFEDNDFLDTLIDDGVHSLLNSVLGYKNYNELVSNIDNGELKPSAEQKWKDLVNGCTYIVNDKEYLWKGLLYKVGTTPKSILANYVYCTYLEESKSIVAGVGEVVVNGKNATNVNSTQRYINAWNDFIYELVCSLASSKGFYYHCGVPIFDYFASSESYDVSLFSFLEHNKESYPNCTFNLPNQRKIEIKNTLGL